MILETSDCIIAQATAPGKGARAIIRLSGTGVSEIVRRVGRFDNISSEIIDRLKTVIVSGTLKLSAPCELEIPCDLYAWSSGRGFTGQESAELHLPGSQPVIEMVIDLFCRSGLVRLAAPGEFTLRSFLAGKIDLTQAEAVLGVIDAASPEQLQVALAQLAGGMTKPLHRLRQTLLYLICELEATLDFSEEEIQFISEEELVNRLEEVAEQLSLMSEKLSGRTHSLDLKSVVLLGQPNVGKSTLFNALGAMAPAAGANEGRFSRIDALVSATAGTTRDYLQQTIRIEDNDYSLIDSAGYQPSASCDSAIDCKSQEATDFVRIQGEILLFCIHAERLNRREPGNKSELFISDITCWEQELIDDKRTILVVTQSDRLATPAGNAGISPATAAEIVINSDNQESRTTKRFIMTSARTGAGLQTVLTGIASFYCDQSPWQEVVPATATRCRDALEKTFDSVEQALHLARINGDEVLITAELRQAANQLGLVTGEVSTEEILDNIFSRFCIGK